MPNIREERAFPSFTDLQHDLADMIADFHPGMRFGCTVEGENRIDDGLEAAAFDIRPDGPEYLVGDHRLELDRARAKRRAGQSQTAAHDVGDEDIRLCAALERDGN